MAADLSATTMLHIIDNLLPASALQDLRDLCDIHGRLKEEHDGDAQFSWRPETGSPRSIHGAAQQAVVDHYLDEALPTGEKSRPRPCVENPVVDVQSGGGVPPQRAGRVQPVRKPNRLQTVQGDRKWLTPESF